MKKFTFFLLIVLFFFLKIDSAYSLKLFEKDFISPYCQGNDSFNSIDIFTSEKIPKNIDIKIINSRSWYKSFFRAVRSIGPKKWMSSQKIDRRAKKYHRAKLTAYYENDLKCIFNANIRIHGSRGDHISPSNFISSMRIKLMDGNILHKSQFILFLPKSRNNDNEIFITTLLKELNFLSPLTFSTIVKVNDSEPTKFLFQEKLARELLTANKRRDGIFLAANKTSQFVKSTNTNSKGTFNLGRVISNMDVGNKKTIKALDKMNYLYLQTMGYGNGTKFIGTNLFKHKKIHYLNIKKDYLNGDNIGFEKFSVFDSIMIATGGVHGLAMEDRRFYYDIINDRIEPVYYDGMNKILNKDFELKIYGAFEHHKFGAKKAKDYISKLNISKFQKELNLRGLNLNMNEINNLFLRIVNNLDLILGAELVDFENPYVKKFYSKHEKKNKIKFKLAFNGNNNTFKLCDVFLENCVVEKFNSLEAIDIFKEQVATINGKHIFYVRGTIESYINNLPPDNGGLSGMRKLNFDSDSEIFINNKVKVDINDNTKIIKLLMLDVSGRAVVRGKKLNGWVFSLQGDSKNFTGKNIKPHDVDPQGCITFIDSEIEEISIYAENTTCSNAIQFIRTNGTINTIKIRNAIYDAFDSDFSNLEIKNIEVNNAGQECIGLKGGKYKIIKANLKNCKDKAVSSGEISQVIIEKIEISNSRFGLAAKDSGIIIAKDVKIEKTDVCLIAYRNKIEFQGSYINTSASNYFCENNYYFIHNGSKWENFN